jgi:hypothetical protein
VYDALAQGRRCTPDVCRGHRDSDPVPPGVLAPAAAARRILAAGAIVQTSSLVAGTACGPAVSDGTVGRYRRYRHLARVIVSLTNDQLAHRPSDRRRRRRSPLRSR